MRKILCVGLAIACAMNVLAQETLKIKGKITDISNDAIGILSSSKEKKEFALKDGNFQVEIPFGEKPENIYLYITEGENSRYAIFFVGGENIKIEGSINDFPSNILAQNSKYDKVRYEEYQVTKELEEKLEELEDEAYEMMENGVSKDSVYQLFMSEVEPVGKMYQVIQQLNDVKFNFIKDNINTAYGQSLLMYITGDFADEQFKVLANLVDDKYKNSVETKFLQALANYPTLKEGDKHYDFTALDVNEKQVNFKSFFDGRYVLLDFSTYHCGYCQREAPLTAELSKNLKEKINFVTYYVDGDKEGINEYIQLKGSADNLVWNKDGRFNSTKAKYRMDTTPSYVLFDPKGKLIATFVGAQTNFKERLLPHMK